MEQTILPKIRQTTKNPTTEHINMLISNASPRMALFLSMSKDLGTRPIELTWLKIKDINLENGTVNITSAKHCVGRTLRPKTKTLDMLKQYINKKDLKQNDRLFPTKSENICDNYCRIRNALAKNSKTPQSNKSDYTTSATTTQQCYTTKPKTTPRQNSTRTQRPKNNTKIHSATRNHRIR